MVVLIATNAIHVCFPFLRGIMKINGTAYRTIWAEADTLRVIDQRVLPHRFEILTLHTLADVCLAICNMTVRGAGLIGATAGYGMWLAAQEAAQQTRSLPDFLEHMERAGKQLMATRPTAVNLAVAVQRQLRVQRQLATQNQLGKLTEAESLAEACRVARAKAETIADEDADFCKRLGQHGVAVLLALHAQHPERPLHILTHCNAGWLAFVDFGSALSPVYAAHDMGIPVHVWVDETRPRNQGASLTAFELSRHGVPHSVIADNAGGHLMRQGMVDVVITGADRVARNGDAANKIGTYLKALAACDNNVPFYIALPSSTFDFALAHGDSIPIEERHGDEVSFIAGLLPDGTMVEVRLCPPESPARNWAFDVTPARLITGLITERGVCPATEAAILGLFPEHNPQGKILFRVEHRQSPLGDEVPACLVKNLDTQRTRLHKAQLIGVLPNDVGFGNISVRLNNGFVITGSATGAPRELGPEGYAVVEICFPDENRVVSHGPAKPSSESMTHSAIYTAKPAVGSVAHAHAPALFQKLLAGNCPRTAESATYGTPLMARAVAELLDTLPETGFFITPGHPDGIFAFAPTPEATAQILLNLQADYLSFSTLTESSSI